MRRLSLHVAVACVMAMFGTTWAEDEQSLVLWNRLGSESDVLNSAVGPGGKLNGGRFVEGRFGKGIELNMQEQFGVTFPPEIVPGPDGCIEFWAKLVDFPSELHWGDRPGLIAATDEGGSRHFMLHFNGNDGRANGGLCARVAGLGNAGTGLFGNWTYARALGTDAVSDWHHYALVWATGGIPGVADDSRKAAVFVDGQLNSHRWGGTGEKLDVPTDGSFGLLCHQGMTSGRVIFDNLKIWNYAKTDFSDRNIEGIMSYPDLVPQNLSATPPQVQHGDMFFVQWIVKNSSLVRVDDHWKDAVYLSQDEFLDENDERIAEWDAIDTVPLAGRGLYGGFAVLTVTCTRPGSYYIIVNLDDEEDVIEEDEDNNTISCQIEILPVPALELVIDGYSLIERRSLGEGIYDYELVLRVRNDGTEDAHNASASLIAWHTANISVPDADVTFGVIAVGETITGADTFVIRIDRYVFVDEIETEWQINCDEKQSSQALTIMLTPADVSGDDCVDVRDLLFIRANLGLAGSGIVTPEADINADGVCNVLDLLFVRSNLGRGGGCP